MEEILLQQEEKYNGWLVSNSLVKRSLAVVGHYFLGYLIILIPILLVCLLIGVAIGFFIR